MKNWLLFLTVLFTATQTYGFEFEHISYEDHDHTTWHVDKHEPITHYTDPNRKPAVYDPKQATREIPQETLNLLLTRSNTVAQAESLIAKGANINAIGQDRETLFEHAADTGNVEMLNYLMDKEANPLSGRNGAYREFILHIQAEYGNNNVPLAVLNLKEKLQQYSLESIGKNARADVALDGPKIVAFLELCNDPFITYKVIVDLEKTDLRQTVLMKEIRTIEQKQVRERQKQIAKKSILTQLKQLFEWLSTRISGRKFTTVALLSVGDQSFYLGSPYKLTTKEEENLSRIMQLANKPLTEPELRELQDLVHANRTLINALSLKTRGGAYQLFDDYLKTKLTANNVKPNQ